MGNIDVISIYRYRHEENSNMISIFANIAIPLHLFLGNHSFHHENNFPDSHNLASLKESNQKVPL